MGLDPYPLAGWSVDRLAAQMIVVRTTGLLFDHQVQYPVWEADSESLRRLVELGVGGVIFLGGSGAELALKTAGLQELALSVGSPQLLLCADIEEGVGQRFGGGTWFAPPMALGEIAKTDLGRAVELAAVMGRATAVEARAIGLNWILGPVVDVNNNRDNPVINIRSFGEDAETVRDLARSFVRGTVGCGVLTCAKHFPGHGDTDLDSHLELPRIEHDMERLERLEFVPFRGVMEGGSVGCGVGGARDARPYGDGDGRYEGEDGCEVDAVMTAHLEVGAIDDSEITTFSYALNTGLLREKWGFEGLIVTDALVMGAIEKRYGNAETAIRVVEGGADLLMMPVDAIGAIEAIVSAVEAGRITRGRLEASVRRILAAKDRTFGQAGVQPQAVTMAGLVEAMAGPEFQAAARSILVESMRVRRGEALGGDGVNLVLVDDLVGCPFLSRTAGAMVIPSSRGYETRVIDASSEVFEVDRRTVLQVFVRGNPLKSTAKYVARIEAWIARLRDQLDAVVVYGSPYVAESLFVGLPDSVTTVFSYGQMPIAQRVALEWLFGVDASEEGGSTEGMFV